MTNYRRGARQEKRVKTWLESLGYFVIDARGSHGGADLVALNAEYVRVIQVKSGRRLSTTERAKAIAALRTIPIPPNGTLEMMTMRKYARVPEVEIL